MLHVRLTYVIKVLLTYLLTYLLTPSCYAETVSCSVMHKTNLRVALQDAAPERRQRSREFSETLTFPFFPINELSSSLLFPFPRERVIHSHSHGNPVGIPTSCSRLYWEELAFNGQVDASRRCAQKCTCTWVDRECSDYITLGDFRHLVVRESNLHTRTHAHAHPWWPLGGLYRYAKFGWNRCSTFANMKLSVVCPFGVFGRFHPQNGEQCQRNPQKAHPCASPRRLSHQAWKSVDGSDL